MLLATDNQPLAGVYAAGATHQDGSLTLVLNPADVAALTPPDDPSYDFSARDKVAWQCFFGQAQYSADRVTVIPGEKGYAGFFRQVTLDPVRYPTVTVQAPDCAKRWALMLKFADGETLNLVTNGAAGKRTVPFADKLTNRAPRACEISFRVYGGPASFASIHFPAAPAAAVAAPAPIPVRVTVPLTKAGDYAAAARVGSNAVPVRIVCHAAHGATWADLDLALGGRTVVTLTPAPARPTATLTSPR